MHFKFRHGLILLSSACLILAAPVHARAAYKATAKTVCSTKTTVHLRKGPGLDYPVQTTIRKGARVKRSGFPAPGQLSRSTAPSVTSNPAI